MLAESYFNTEIHESTTPGVTCVATSLLFPKGSSIRETPHHKLQRRAQNLLTHSYRPEGVELPGLKQTQTETQTHPPLPEALAVNPTFMFLLCGSHFLDLPGRLHKEWKDGPQAKNVNKLVAVVCALGPDHGVVQHLQGAAPGDLLLPTSKRDSRRRTRFLMRTQLGKKRQTSPNKNRTVKMSSQKEDIYVISKHIC